MASSILDSIHKGIQTTNSIIWNTSTFGKLDGRRIGESNGFFEFVTKVVTREIGKSLLASMTYPADMNLINNPFSRRYESRSNTGIGNFNFGLPDSPSIGQMYDVYWKEKNVLEFLDDKVGGDLISYTHLQKAAEERSENPYLDKLFAVSTYNPFIEPETYLENVPFWKNLNNSPKRYTPRAPYMIFPLSTYPISTSPNGTINVYNNLFEIYSTDDGPILNSTTDLNINAYTESTREKSKTHWGSLFLTDVSTEMFYQENGKESAGSQRDITSDKHSGDGTLVDVISLNEGNLKDTRGLLHKTNKLFNDGMIGSIINRFKTDVKNHENEPSVINSAYDDEYGHSRGRNLRKSGNSTNENGYENPYCRVWTSHHRYSKWNDLIRPLNENPTNDYGGIEDDSAGKIKESYYTQGDGFRPFGGNDRLSSMSVLDYTNKMPRVRIAPSHGKDGEMVKDSIKKCMFSIENLAWRDINFQAQVVGGVDKNGGKKYKYGKVLSDEQIGPNGGRIMWFPPYNLSFSEQVAAQWNENVFIGRGEKVMSYSHTTRRGTLDFTILVDHPSIINQYSMTQNDDKSAYEKDQELLRYFAGCGPLEINVDSRKTYVAEDKEQGTKTTVKEEDTTNYTTPDAADLANSKPDELELAPTITFKSVFFFPNNYSGKEYSGNKALDIMFHQGKRSDGKTGYEMNFSTASGLTFENGYGGQQYTTMGGQWNGQHPWYFGPNREGTLQSWYYQADQEKFSEKYDDGNRLDMVSYGLNNEAFGNNDFTDRNYLLGLSGSTVNVNWSSEILSKVNEILGGELRKDGDSDLKYVLPSYFVYNGGISNIISKLEKEITPMPKYKVTFDCVGYASTDGYIEKNSMLASDRANTIANWFESTDIKPERGEVNGNGQLIGNKDVSSKDGKISRCAILTIKLVPDKTVDKQQPTVDSATTKDVPKKEESKQDNITGTTKSASQTENVVKEVNTYDNEYKYFMQINDSKDGNEYFIKNYISEQVKYFDPAFHSISPEGFNARLTFLHQCTRQGPTISASDDEMNTHTMGAGNLSFGRPPFCILRIGDFYNTKICIDSINIVYDNDGGVQWDLNPEGIGVQPMMAKVTIGFTFLGGSDLSGPIDRLQNAVSHNYYANTSVYDRRADYREQFRTKTDDTAHMWIPTMNDKNGNANNNISEHSEWPTKEKDNDK